jgi:16S rRNA (guanine527-N7)-methyltransferase
MKPYDSGDFQKDLDVSRETMARLERYATLLEKWSRAINLVGRASLPDLWRRHMLDSAQLLALLPPPPIGRPMVLLDLGSGAGFPGLVLAIQGAGEVHLVESDAKKAAFLQKAAQVTETIVTIHNDRIEDLLAIRADVLTARALAPLPRLLDLVEPFFQNPEFAVPNEQANSPANTKGPTAIFPKGRNADRELTDSAEKWMMHAEVIPSRSDPLGRIIRLQGLARKGRRP